MINESVRLAKQYLDKFYELLLKQGIDKKEVNILRKNCEKYEDFAYISKYLNNNFKNVLFEEMDAYFAVLEKQIGDIKKDTNSMINDFVKGKNELNVSAIKKALKKIDKQSSALQKGLELIYINNIHSFKEDMIRELDSYKSKVKNDEYFEIDQIKENIAKYVKDIFATLDSLISQRNIKNFYKVYCDTLKSKFSYYYDNHDSKTGSIPNWAKGILFLLPWIIGFALFTLYPLLQTFIFSFSKVSLTTNGFESSWIGGENYKNILQDTDFILAIKNYAANMLVYVPLITVFSLILALLLNTQVKGIGFFRTIFFFPVIITSGPVIKILIEQGVTSMPGLNSVLNIEQIQASLPPFIGSMFNILTSEFIMILWFSGIQILVFVTGLQRIDKGVYEASSIDGANKWEQFWKVTLPAINPVIVINVVFTVVMQSIFALNPIIIKIQNDMNDTSSGKGYQYSSALAFAYFLIVIITLVVFVLIFKKHTKKEKKVRN